MENNNPRTEDYGDGFYEDEEYVPAPYDDNGDGFFEEEQEEMKKGGCLSKLIKAALVIIVIIILAIAATVAVILMRVHYTGENPDHSIAQSQGVELRTKQGVENIMIFGEDDHSEDSHGRSDAMILLTIDSNNKILKQTSLMRDLYLEIPGHGYDKLNSAYAYGGPSLAVETIELNFHIRIDDYIIIDFNSFTDIIDSLGGIDMQLTKEEIEYIDWQSYRNKQTEEESELDSGSFDYEINDEGEQVTKVHLNGRQALWYARDRDSAGSDYDRAWRQRMVIDTVLDKLKESDPFRISAAAMGASQYVSTNMSPFTLTGKGASLLTALGWTREQYRVPQRDNVYDQWTDNAGLALVIADNDKAIEELHSFVFGE